MTINIYIKANKMYYMFEEGMSEIYLQTVFSKKRKAFGFCTLKYIYNKI